jgi:hypothetical protein
LAEILNHIKLNIFEEFIRIEESIDLIKKVKSHATLKKNGNLINYIPLIGNVSYRFRREARIEYFEHTSLSILFLLIITDIRKNSALLTKIVKRRMKKIVIKCDH